ncbi:hypothetical protein GKG47_03660 [Lactonifactor sp. BIOML-A3]|uniref:FIVAR domain-containing protein n=1 Tax=Lactonifactor sp. BIOML-A3 TaxID=2584656 RepID=UPI0012AFC134|nr:FIVAR domain-containing protein [Lactonifactor sp. BIOML-A3]MSA11546.1 hypothetical protein [Lactonifactor sp. BIOML-A3]
MKSKRLNKHIAGAFSLGLVLSLSSASVSADSSGIQGYDTAVSSALSGDVSGDSPAYADPAGSKDQVLADKKGLELAVSMAEELKNGGQSFLEEGWLAVDIALEKAKAVLDDEDATQIEINEAYTQLVSACADLIPGVEKEGLKSAIDSAREILEDEETIRLYTQESVQAAKDALAEAERVYNTEYAVPDQGQQAVNDATSKLITAVNNMLEAEQGKWVQDEHGWRYYNQDGKFTVNNWQYIDGSWYYFNGGGYRVTGWLQLGNTWYYLYKDGTMATGWLLEGKTWYYLKDSGAMATGWVLDGNTWYYLKGSGAMATGWIQLGNTWYYLKGSGAMATGWIQLGSTWYYLKASGAMATGWVLDGKTWYYLKSSGAMATDWLLDGKTWYYLKGNGAMATGWIKVRGVWYYCSSSGAMQTGWLLDGKTWYYLKDNGAMAANTWIGRYYVNGSGAWVKTR